jgi:hypothetical protein
MMMNTNKKITASLFVLVLALVVVGTAKFCAAYGEGYPPPAPQLVSPSNSILVTIGSLTLTWNAIPHANYYNVAYIGESDYSQGLDLWAAFSDGTYSQNLQNTEYTITEEYLRDVMVYNTARSDDTFYWKVNANVDSVYYWPESWSPFSEAWCFNVLKWPAAWVDNTYWEAWTYDNSLEMIDYQTYLNRSYWGRPSPGYWELDTIPITISHTPHLRWTDRSTDQQPKPVNFADRYRVQLSASSAFDSLIADITTENISYTTPALSPGAYYWRVRSETNDGQLVTEWNSPRKFVIASGPTGTMGVSVSISQTSQSGANGATLTYTVTVNNTGNASDNYSLTVTDDAGWSPSVSPTSLLNILSGSSGAATLSVTIPSGAVDGTIDSITVTATSQTNNTVENSATCTAIVAAGGGATGGGTSPVVYVGVAVVIVAILGAILVVIKPF